MSGGETELKRRACPFCGCTNQDFLRHGASLSRLVSFIECDDCGAQGPTTETDEQAIEAWNRRAS